MIRIFLGNLGSGKTLSAVRELALDNSGRKTYTNISVRGIKNAVHIKPEYVIKKEEDEKGKLKLDLNTEYWNQQKKPLNLLWDEVHLTANSRRSMSSINQVFSKFIAMGRRIVGFDKRGYGCLTFIAQAERTIDRNIKELANEIRYHVSYWYIECNSCKSKIIVSSEMEQFSKCTKCGSWEIERKGLQIEVKRYKSWANYLNSQIDTKKHKWHFDRFMLYDAEDYYKYYETLQMEDIWGDYIKED